MKNIFKFVIAITISELAGVLGSLFTIPAVTTWYATLTKPQFSPPNWIFGPVWTTLYFLIGISLYLVWKNDFKILHPMSLKKSWNAWSGQLWAGPLQKINIIAIFAVQYTLNVLWSLVFFGLHSPGIAFSVIVALWISIVYLMINFYRVSKASAWILLPYFLWVTFAAYLNYAIFSLNYLVK